MHHSVFKLGIPSIKRNSFNVSSPKEITSVFNWKHQVSSSLSLKRLYGQFPPRIPLLPPHIDYALNVIDKSHIDFTTMAALEKAYFKIEKNYMKLPRKRKRKNFPLIVLEGLDGCGKSAVGKRVAHTIGAEYRVSPSKVLSKIRAKFEDSPLPVRAAFYTVGNHIVSMELFPAISRKTIILDRFWHSTSAFAIAQAAFTDVFFPLPEPDDKIYVWPRDLVKPDLVLFLDVTEENRINRHCSRGTSNTKQEQLLANNAKFRNLVLTSYSRMRDPSIVKIDANPKFEDVVDAVEEKVKAVLESYKHRKKPYDDYDDDE